MTLARWTLCLTAGLGFTLGAGAALPPPLERVLHEQHLPPAAVSVLVQAVDGRAPLLALNLDEPRNPASTIKLVTTYAALEQLGPQHRWRTEAYLLGPLQDGVLTGDLLLKGRGDPYLIAEEMWKFAGELRAKGLRKITGGLVIDDSAFAPAPRAAGDFDNQPLRLYNVQPNAMMVNFKAFTFHFQPAANGAGVSISADPPLPNLLIDNQLQLVDGRCGGVLAHVEMSVAEDPSEPRVRFSGQYPRSCGKESLPRTALSPDAYAYGLFRLVWEQWGGELAGGVSRGVMPAGHEPFHVWYSPPLAEVIRPLNKWSNNVMADALLYALADRRGAPPLQPADGAREIEQFLRTQGVDTKGLVLENGSGLSRVTRITARTMGEMLQVAWRSPYMPEYLASLSLVGQDGTTRKRFRRGPENGRMHLKTGHLGDVAAVAGYVLAASGRTYAVTLLMNHPTVNQGSGSALINALLAWTYRQ